MQQLTIPRRDRIDHCINNDTSCVGSGCRPRIPTPWARCLCHRDHLSSPVTFHGDRPILEAHPPLLSDGSPVQRDAVGLISRKAVQRYAHGIRVQSGP